MSFCAVKWSYTSPQVLDAGLSQTQLAVLRALCWVYNDKDRTLTNNNCYPSVGFLAAVTGLKTSTVNKAKDVLAKKDLIQWNRAANFGGSPNHTNQYMINCPELIKLLKANAAHLYDTGKIAPDDDVDEKPRASVLAAGQLYERPDPESLTMSFSTPLTKAESCWMADALAFTHDSPQNRKVLYAALQTQVNIAAARHVLRRVLATSQKGRRIVNRVGYLLKALTREADSAKSI